MSLLRQSGGVEAFCYRVLLLMLCQVSACSPLPLRLLFLEDLTQKPLSSRSTPCMICMPLPSNDKCSGDDPAFLCHVPAALCSLVCSPFVRSRARAWLTSEKWSRGSTSLHHFEHKHLIWPCLATWVYSHMSGLHASGRRRATRVRVLGYVG